MPVEFTYCGPPAVPDGVWDRWNLDPYLLLPLLGLAGLFVLIGAAREERWRWFALALGALALAFVSPLCALAVSLFTARTLDHLVVISLAAPLMAVALFGIRETDLKLSPAIAALANAATLWAWHLPSAYSAALADPLWYWAMQGSLFVSGLWFWAALLSRRTAPVLGMAALAAFSAQMGLLGAILVFAPAALYAPHVGTTAVWGLTPLEDQQLAGVVMWVLGALPYLAAAIVALGLWLKAAESVRAPA